MSSVLCVICAVTAHVKMWRAAGVSVYTLRRLPGNSLSSERKKASLNRKNHHCPVQDEDR